jgi:hypothetical protein
MLTRDPDPCVAIWHMALAPIRRPERRHWWRELVTQVYRDARDAREALRESEPYLQHERDDFDREHPPVALRDIMVGLSRGQVDPPNWGFHL